MTATERTVIANMLIQDYLEKSTAQPLPDSDDLEELSFGEYLVERGEISRDELYTAMQLQDRNPGVRLAECIASLGILSWPHTDRLYLDYASFPTYYG